MAVVKNRFFAVQNSILNIEMARWKLFFFVTIIFGALAQSQENADKSFNFKWDNGFKLQSADALISLKFGGSLFVDHGFFYQDSQLTETFGALESKSGTEIRRARLFFSGSVFRNTFFKFQVDFAGDEVELKDVYIGISDIPGIGNFQIGHFKEPFRLSALTSSKYFTFMEGGANSDFSQGRNNGAMIFNDFLNDRLSAQLAAFRNGSNDSNDVSANDGYVLTGRGTGIPLRNDANRQLLHVGASYSFRKPDSKKYEISIAPGSHLSEDYISTGIIESVDDVSLINFESAFIQGPFSVQAEYLIASVNTIDYDYQFSNYYAELSYFITGESKNFESSYDGFGRITPKRNFGGLQKGFGALEVAFRYSKTDLSDKIIFGGNQTDFTFGINWYLNSATRVMVNYVKANIEDKGNLDLVQARFQIDF